MSTLYVVATPIGNMEDITFRAIRVLKEVDMILCEDTRMTKKILGKYEIDTPMMSYHARSKITKIEKILELLKEGKDLALVSDAGTPTISDPGSILVSTIREHFRLPESPTGHGDMPVSGSRDNRRDPRKSGDDGSVCGDDGVGVNIVSVPGASAVTAALSIAGVPASKFLFLGFLPHKKGRNTLFKEIEKEVEDKKRTVVFYESPHRIMKTLESLKEYCPDKKISIAREITKMHEQVISGTATEIFNYFEERKDKVRGEFVVIIS